MKKVIFVLPLIFQVLFAQNQTLLTIDDVAVSLNEFERVYTKNNINNQADYSKESLDEYLDLFIKFKLKVTEADAMQLDTVKSIQSELQMYQKQLIKNYSNNKEITEEIVKQAYDRSKVEVDASHILILWPNEYPSDQDSLQVLKEILAVKKKAKASNFATLAAANSQDPSAKDNAGRLGYLTVFQTVYPFENALYNTKPGTISEPVATQFGYHLVLVHQTRPARGRIKTAHLLIKSKQTDSEEKKAIAKQKAQTIYNELKTGTMDFQSAVQKYSEDVKTKNQGGKLPELSSAEMIGSFADAAFSLQNDGDFSQPVLTQIGWHIIQRISKTEIQDYQEVKNELTAKVERDSRSNVAIQRTIEDSKSEFGFKSNEEAINELIDILSKTYRMNKFDADPAKYTKEIFRIGDKAYSQDQFISYANRSFSKKANMESVIPLLKATLVKFQNKEIQKYREEHLDEINEDYKHLLQEYHDGILLFELTDQEVWSKAVKDTSGLKEYFNKNRSNYMWGERIKYTKYTFATEKAAVIGKKLLSKGKSAEAVGKKLNKKEEVYTFETFKKEQENFDVSGLSWEKGSTASSLLENGSTEYWVVDEIVSPEAKMLNETRGYVISDYQNFLEQEWIAKLKSKYQVEVNESLFQSLIKD